MVGLAFSVVICASSKAPVPHHSEGPSTLLYLPHLANEYRHLVLVPAAGWMLPLIGPLMVVISHLGPCSSSKLGLHSSFLMAAKLVLPFLFLWYLLPPKTACFLSWSGLPTRRRMLLSDGGLLLQVVRACLCACHANFFFGLLLHLLFGLGQPF